MDDSRPEIPREEIVPSLWRKYTLTPEFKAGRIHSINSTHDLVRREESRGLERIIKRFIGDLRKVDATSDTYAKRGVGDWFTEWKTMHELLFRTVVKEELRGRFRQKDVRFGAPGDDELHKIPRWQEVTNEMQVYARNISDDIVYVDVKNLESVCTFLAKVHYQFIRIHPFEDGNGRIARAITDQLGICLGLPPIIAGFPRTDSEKKKKYHEAITNCVGDSNCMALKSWIMDQVLRKIEELA